MSARLYQSNAPDCPGVLGASSGFSDFRFKSDVII